MHVLVIVISLFTDSKKQPHPLCMVTYHLIGGVLPPPTSHGNSKTYKPFLPTYPSTLQRIKDDEGPKATVEKVSYQMGVVLGASTSGQLPRDEQQVSNQRRKRKFSEISTGTPADSLFVVRQRAHSQDPAQEFIRDIKTASEPAIVLEDEQQLNDLVRFGISPLEFCIITIDPTFTLGEFDLSPIDTFYWKLINHQYFLVH